MKNKTLFFSALFSLFFIAALFSVSSVQAATSTCVLNATLVNQNPYPAVPGDYVKVLFQLTGVQDPSCGKVTFQIVPEYPFSLNPNASAVRQIQGGTFTSNYNSAYMIPYTLRVDKNAVDGENTLRVRYSYQGGSTQVNDFNITVNNTRADFEIYVKDYNPASKELTLDILNSGKNNVNALTIMVPRNQGLKVDGANVNVLGSLDANDDTTTTFTAEANASTQVMATIMYTDTNGIRREVNKTFSFDPAYFASNQSSGGIPIYVYIIIVLLIIAGLWWWRRRVAKSRKKKKLNI